jgi:copper chaperone CopZ
MKYSYQISGMTCQGCANNIEQALKSQPFFESVSVSLQSSKLTLISKQEIKLETLNKIVSKIGNYKIHDQIPNPLDSLKQYFESKKPILIGLSIIIIASSAIQVSRTSSTTNDWLIDYMGLFFIIFSFLKFFDLNGFKNTFSQYDLIAKKIPSFGLVYPFIELILGVGFLSRTLLLYANIITLIIMIIQSIGVFQSLRRKTQIQCACMGSSISVPLSSLTLLEDIIMVIMSAYMISQLIQ